MVARQQAGAPTLERLGPSHLVETFAFLDRDPVLNVYLLALTLRDALAQPRDEYWVARRRGDIVALLYLGGQSGAVLPLGDDGPALALLADQARHRLTFLPRRFQVIGPRAAVDTVVQHVARAGFSPWLTREQIYMELDPARLPPFARLPALAAARADDHDLVFESGARFGSRSWAKTRAPWIPRATRVASRRNSATGTPTCGRTARSSSSARA
jgi:hypothetical protein